MKEQREIIDKILRVRQEIRDAKQQGPSTSTTDRGTSPLADVN
jgi:hypothetical protein